MYTTTTTNKRTEKKVYGKWYSGYKDLMWE